MKKIIKVFIMCLTIILFLSAIYIVNKGIKSYKNETPTKLFGYILSIVPTNSMEPVIKPGDFVLSQEVDFSEINVGDDIVYRSETKKIFIVHRVLKKNDDGSLIMKGINNPIQDSEVVTEKNYISKVVKVISLTNLGGLILNHRNLIFVILVLIFLFLLVLELFKMILLVKEEKIKLKEKEREELKNKFIEEERKKIKEEIKKEIEKGKIIER